MFFAFWIALSDSMNKNLAIANRSHVSCTHNTLRFEGTHRPKYYTVTLKSRLRVTQGHWKRNHWTVMRPSPLLNWDQGQGQEWWSQDQEWWGQSQRHDWIETKAQGTSDEAKTRNDEAKAKAMTELRPRSRPRVMKPRPRPWLTWDQGPGHEWWGQDQEWRG